MEPLTVIIMIVGILLFGGIMAWFMPPLPAPNEKKSPTAEERVGRIERMLYDYGFHEPHCTKRDSMRRQESNPSVHVVSQPCSCWLKNRGSYNEFT